MASMEEIVAEYVASMRPMSKTATAQLDEWMVTGCPLEPVPVLADCVHKFAGSAGSAGFTHLSMVATVLELMLRAVHAKDDLTPVTREQFALLIKDFSGVANGISVEKSSLISGDEDDVFLSFDEFGHILLVGLPRPIEAMLTFICEQRMGMPLSLPSQDMLSDIVPERAPKLAVVSEPVPDYSFPIFVFSPMRFAQLTTGEFAAA